MAESLDGLSEVQLKEYQEIFSVFDSDENGYITLVKLGQVMRYFGWDPSETILQVGRNFLKINIFAHRKIIIR